MKKILSAVLILAMLTALLTACGTSGSSDSDSSDDTQKTASDLRYDEEGGLFDTSFVHTVNVEISEDDWNDLLKNPLNKIKYKVNVTIDGTTVENVSFATKGNTSLSQVADSDSDRYSFKLNFGKYADGQTYQGLNKLNLNNIMSDATYMKDYLSYLIMRKAGVSASLTSYAMLSVNGEPHGLYIAIEDVGDSFLERNTGDDDGALYKPESERLANMDKNGDMKKNDIQNPDNAGDNNNGMPQTLDGSNGDRPQPPTDENGNITMPDGNTPPAQNGGEPPQLPQGGMAPPDSGNGEMPQMPTDENGDIAMPEGTMTPPYGGMGGMGSEKAAGADLVYSDDNTDSYSDIFDNEENDVSDEDRAELIAALKALSTGENIDDSWDMDQIIRYFVAHNFVLNYDSYTGNMLHNYYLYESDGKVTVFPWDYNLSFCGFQGAADATSAANTPIDSPLSGATEDSRPLWKVIVSNEKYLNLYHQYYEELIIDFFESGECEQEIRRVYEMIRPYVADDPSAFYTVDQFDKAVETLTSFCDLRAQSIRKQLDGNLGTTTDTQEKSDLVDASALTLSDMGNQPRTNPNPL